MTPVTEPEVSVFIRVRDEGAALSEVLAALGRQQLDAATEIVVLDNESADDTVAVALQHGARVFSLPRAHFGYGRALNLGVMLCRGAIIVVLSSHSVPCSRDWLAELIAPLRAGTADAAFCRQVPGPGATRLERYRFRYFPEASRIIGPDDFLARCSRGGDPYETAVFSNSACAVNRQAALSLPFRDLPYAEDRSFAIDCFMTGRKIAYVSGCSVEYERPATWQSAYHVARRAQISKRLIRELAATYTGIRFASWPDQASRLARAVLVAPGLMIKLMLSLREPRGRRLRSAGFAWISTGGTLGLAQGTVGWRDQAGRLSCDVAALQEARDHCREITAPAG